MTYPSQTEGYTLSDHIHLLEEYLGRKVEVIVHNTTPLPDHILKQYTDSGASVVVNDLEDEPF